MTKATHNGTCQACGRSQAVTARGTLAKHGYTVDYGYFSGTCSGSGKLPLEQDTKHNVEVVAAIRDWADKQDEKAAREIYEIVVSVYVNGTASTIGGYQNETMNREQFIEHTKGFAGLQGVEAWNSAVDSFKLNLTRNAAFARKDADNLDTLRGATFGNDLTPREVEGAPQPKRESFSADSAGRANAKAYDRQRELKAQGIRSRVTGDAGYATITYKA
jgi:hypothetical protein